MSMEIFWISGSAPAWRVLLVLEAKGLVYDSRVLQTSRKEQKQAWFLELNPRGQIPLLKDGDTVVTESLAIMHYLEARYPTPAMFGDDPDLTARVEQTVHEILSYVDGPVADFVQPVFRNKVEENKAGLGTAAAAIRGELSGLEKRLSEHDWLVGKDFSAADAVFIPTFQRLLRAIDKEPQLAADLGLGSLGRDFPALAGWNSRAQDLPAFDATFPPHWRE